MTQLNNFLCAFYKGTKVVILSLELLVSASLKNLAFIIYRPCAWHIIRYLTDIILILSMTLQESHFITVCCWENWGSKKSQLFFMVSLKPSPNSGCLLPLVSLNVCILGADTCILCLPGTWYHNQSWSPGTGAKMSFIVFYCLSNLSRDY